MTRENGGMSELEAFLSLIILPLPYLPLRSRAREMWVTKVWEGIDGREKGWQTKRRGIAASPIHSALCTRYLTEEPLWRREEISNQEKEKTEIIQNKIAKTKDFWILFPKLLNRLGMKWTKESQPFHLSFPQSIFISWSQKWMVGTKDSISFLSLPCCTRS